MAHRDYWALKVWYAYYGAQLGHENLYIIEHGHDPRYRRLFPKANFVTYPRDLTGQSFDAERYDFMDVIQTELCQDYSHIIRTDADEIIAYDVKRYDGFESLAAQCDGFLMATGLQLVDDGRNLFRGPGDIRLPKRAVFDSRYSKAWLTDGDWKLRDHGVVAKQGHQRSVSHHLVEGVYLLHLKYANVSALEQQSAVRAGVLSRDDADNLTQMWGNDATYHGLIEKHAAGELRDFGRLDALARDHAVINTQAADDKKIFRIKRGFWKGPAHLPRRVIRSMQE